MADKTRALTVARAVPHEVLRYSPAQDNFGKHSAAELGLDPAGVLKTLVVSHGRDLAICCVPVAGRLSLKSAAAALGWKKATLADPARAQRATGYVVGGISPLGTRTRLRTLIDASVAERDNVTVSGGQRGLSIRLAPADLTQLTQASFVDLATS